MFFFIYFFFYFFLLKTQLFVRTQEAIVALFGELNIFKKVQDLAECNLNVIQM